MKEYFTDWDKRILITGINDDNRTWLSDFLSTLGVVGLPPNLKIGYEKVAEINLEVKNGKRIGGWMPYKGWYEKEEYVFDYILHIESIQSFCFRVEDTNQLIEIDGMQYSLSEVRKAISRLTPVK